MVEAEGRVFEFQSEEAITPDVLETFPYEYPEREALVEIDTDEWSCVCPFSGLPDFGTLTVRYLPTESCIELKSLKYYLDGGGARLPAPRRAAHGGHRGSRRVRLGLIGDSPTGRRGENRRRAR